MWGYYLWKDDCFLLKLFAAAQNYGRLRHAQLMGLAELSLAAGELKQAKLLKDQAKREREFGALSCLFVCSETFDPGTPRRSGSTSRRSSWSTTP
jgi:hypothetical protein